MTAHVEVKLAGSLAGPFGGIVRVRGAVRDAGGVEGLVRRGAEETADVRTGEVGRMHGRVAEDKRGGRTGGARGALRALCGKGAGRMVVGKMVVGVVRVVVGIRGGCVERGVCD